MTPKDSSTAKCDQIDSASLGELKLQETRGWHAASLSQHNPDPDGQHLTIDQTALQ